LHSLNATSDLAGELNRERGLVNVPAALARFLADALRPPVFLAALGGLALASWRRDGRSLHVPIALLGCGVLAFIAAGVAGLSLLPRYLTIPAVALTLYAGYAAGGWISLPAGSRLRRRWAAVLAVLAVLGAGFVLARASVLDRFVTELRYIRSTHEDLREILALRAVSAGRTCGPVTLPNYRLVPDTRWILDAGRTQVGARSAKRRESGVALFYADRKSLRRFGFADGTSPSTNAPDPGFVWIARRGHFAAYVSCP
jgi:hypothetical protein